MHSELLIWGYPINDTDLFKAKNIPIVPGYMIMERKKYEKF